MDEFGKLNEKVKDRLSELGFKKPTLIQRRALPKILEGENCLLIAPTGTGKTEAALLPIFSNYFEKNTEEGIKIIYIAPLRALNRDILNRLQRWEEYLDIDIQVRHGDTTKYQRRKQALNPPDMLITTPETLQAILPGSRMKEHLKAVEWVIIDEVHELAESKRGTQLSIGLERLYRYSGTVQRIGLSATVGNSEEIGDFLVGSGRKVEIVDASSAEEMSVRVESPMPTEDDAELSEKLNADPPMIARIRRIRDLIKNHESTLTFVNTRETSETLGSRLKFWDSNFPVSVHHGSLSRGFRVSSEEDFRNGNLKSLICTSSMELGIDIGAIDFVIQYGSPRQVKRLIQRVGRSDHRIGGVSRGTIMGTNPDDVMESGIIAKRAFSHDLEPAKLHENSLDVLSHQIVGLSLDGVRDLEEIFSVIKNAYPYQNLSKDEFSEVVNQLQGQSLLWLDGKDVGRGKSSWKYYYGNLSMIPDIKHYQIIDMVSSESIGSLDEEFVVDQVDLGVTFICKGEAWRVVEVENDQVRVEPTKDPYGAVPAWEGELIPVSFRTAQKVGELRSEVANHLEEGMSEGKIVKELENDYPADRDSLEWVVSYLHKQLDEGSIPTDENIIIENYENFSVLHTCLGTIVNRTLGQILSALLSTRIGASIGLNTDPYRIAFRFPEKEDVKTVEETLKELKSEYLEPILKKILGKSSIFRWRLLHVAKRFGAIKKDADFSEIRGDRLAEAFEGTPIWNETEREVRLEKMDVAKLEQFIELLQNGRVKIETINRSKSRGPAPMSLPILNRLAVSGELVIPERAEREIIKALKRRLRNKQVKLLCLNCLDWSTITRVRRLSENPTCKNCEARLLALVPVREGEVEKALKKQRAGKKLSNEEKDSVGRARDTANLIITHGKKAITAMAGRGVGPATASRILSMQYEKEKDFYQAILHAEREYARTHRFWD